ncbi:MAG: hypothetical protein MK209_03650 [Planctomycetes bacterium]|nr:hypothetical protein [Planctomycetota bacterium]
MAQDVIHTWIGDARYQYHGHDVADVGDVNGDGFADVLVGMPGDDGFGQSAGMARLYSGRDGAQLWAWDGSAGQDELGHAVSSAGDVNGDGINDIIICAIGADAFAQGAGQARVYSGSNFRLIHTLDGAASKDYLGWAASEVGDLNFDGFDEFIVGASKYGAGVFPGPGDGYANVYDGLTGAIIYQVVGPHNTAFTGHAVGGPGDVNGDGAADFLVGSYGTDIGAQNSGSVTLYSGIDGSVLYVWHGDNAKDKLGISVDGAGDVNGDGVLDVVAGGHQAATNGKNSGMARVFSGADGSILYTWYGDDPEDLFGNSVSGGHDLNSDGFDDVVVGIRHDDTWGDNSGAVRAYSGADGSELWTAYGYADHDLFGFAVAVSEDINGDGVADVIGGGTQYNAGPGPGNGMVQALDPTNGPPPPPARYPVLPSTFLALGTGYAEGFEGHAGSPPTYFGINELNAISRDTDPLAWCNIGQNGACSGGISGVGPRTGSYDLEMGAAPGFDGSTTLANGLIIGLNGGGSTSWELDFHVYNFGEEPDGDDGVFVSADGLNWEAVSGGWNGLPTDQWRHVTDIDLNSTSVDISGDFYLLFAQTDNFPIGEDDGILIDDINIAPVSSGYSIVSFTPGTAGRQNSINVEGATPGAASTFAYSFVLGSTPVPGCAGLRADLKRPNVLGSSRADAAGSASYIAFVPPSATGITVHIQAAELSSCQITPVYTHTFP